MIVQNFFIPLQTNGKIYTIPNLIINNKIQTIMKKLLLTVCVAFASINAFCGNEPVVGDQIPLSYTSPYTDPEDNPGRAPILVPVLYIDGYTLTAGTGTLGSTIQLLDEDDNVVFSTFVYVEGDIQLPTTLSGTYTIEVIRGSQTFVGEITL